MGRIELKLRPEPKPTQCFVAHDTKVRAVSLVDACQECGRGKRVGGGSRAAAAPQAWAAVAAGDIHSFKFIAFPLGK